MLMEAARCFDEETVVLNTKPAAAPVETVAPSPAPAESPAPKPAAPPAVAPAAPDDDFVVVATYDGEWKPADELKKNPPN